MCVGPESGVSVRLVATPNRVVMSLVRPELDRPPGPTDGGQDRTQHGPEVRQPLIGM